MAPTFRDRAVTLAEAAYEYALVRLRPAPGERGKEEAAPAPWSDRNVQVLGARATPDAVATIINQRNTGDLRQWADLADAARRSVATIHSEMSTREQSAQETDFRVLPGEGSNKRAARRAADACREVFARWQSRDDSGDTYGAWDRWVAEWVAAAYYPLASRPTSTTPTPGRRGFWTTSSPIRRSTSRPTGCRSPPSTLTRC